MVIYLLSTSCRSDRVEIEADAMCPAFELAYICEGERNTEGHLRGIEHSVFDHYLFYCEAHTKPRYLTLLSN